MEIRTQHTLGMEYSLGKDMGPEEIGQVSNLQRLNNRVEEGVEAQDSMRPRLTKHLVFLLTEKFLGTYFCG